MFMHLLDSNRSLSASLEVSLCRIQLVGLQQSWVLYPSVHNNFKALVADWIILARNECICFQTVHKNIPRIGKIMGAPDCLSIIHHLTTVPAGVKLTQSNKRNRSKILTGLNVRQDPNDPLFIAKLITITTFYQSEVTITITKVFGTVRHLFFP